MLAVRFLSPKDNTAEAMIAFTASHLVTPEGQGSSTERALVVVANGTRRRSNGD
jgi:hypothetical protein